jgi:hypothetical protein
MISETRWFIRVACDAMRVFRIARAVGDRYSAGPGRRGGETAAAKLRLLWRLALRGASPEERDAAEKGAPGSKSFEGIGHSILHSNNETINGAAPPAIAPLPDW